MAPLAAQLYDRMVTSAPGRAMTLPEPSEPDGTIFAFIDESYEPVVAAAAVAVESTDVARMNSDIASTFDRLQNWYQLDGLPSFDEFRKHGFHAASDPYEVRASFVAFLAEVLSFKSLIVYSDRSRRPDLSKKRHLAIIFDQLVRDLIRTYRGRPKIVLYFESAQAMDPYVERLVSLAVGASRRNRPDVVVKFGSKRDPDLLAVPDYVLHIFGQWLSTQQDRSLRLDPTVHTSRSFRAILGSVSACRSIDDGHVVRRTLK